jgi:cytochrome b subunit of formate dehydrogenase
VSYTNGFTPQNGTTRQGETFGPEESTQYEVGLKYEPKDFNALFTVAAFHLTGRVVICVAGIVIFVLSVTGIVIWWKKRGARHRRAGKAEGALTAESYAGE